jgi:uncharacterized SAM-binding protein YcdF (DUF218 family)
MRKTASPIYESFSPQASERERRDLRRERILSAALAGVAAWFLLEQLGVPHVFGIGSGAGLVPLAVLGAALGLTRFRMLPFWTAALLITVTIVVAYTSIIVGPARALIRDDPTPASADAIVVLSAGVTADGYLQQQGLDRILEAAELAKAGVAPVLVMTKEERTVRGVRFTSEVDQRGIVGLAGLTSVVWTGRVKSTHDEALAVSRLSASRGWNHIVLVTSAFHSRRACRTFEKLGLKVSCVPADSRDIAIRRLSYPHDRLGAFGMWLYETAGTLRYRQRGWI